MKTRQQPRGFILVIVLLGMTMMASVALGLALSSSVSRLSAANHDETTALANAAESALELAAQHLAALDLNAVLSGALTSPLVDGLPGPRTVAPGVVVNLTLLTSRLSCGRATPCTDAQVRQVTLDRPWGANNPHWQLFLHQPLAAPTLPGPSPATYVVVWVGDDGREDDGDPLSDGAGPEQEGRYTVRARAEAFGPRGGRKALEAELVQGCGNGPAAPGCVRGSRVQSWRAVNASVP